MTEDLSARIVAFVKPFMETHSSRQPYLIEVLQDSPALDHIDYGIGGAQPCLMIKNTNMVCANTL